MRRGLVTYLALALQLRSSPSGMENSATLAVGRYRRSSSLSDTGLCRVGRHSPACTKTWVTILLVEDRAVAAVVAVAHRAVTFVAAATVHTTVTANPAVVGVTVYADDPAVPAVVDCLRRFLSRTQRIQQIPWSQPPELLHWT